MLLSSEMLLPNGPPPQAVLNQRPLWQFLLVVLTITFVLRLVGLDIAGAMLSGLMLCFVIIMIRDGMQELSKYALVYAVLCGLNFFFDILPLITELGGRVTRTAQPGGSSIMNDDTRQDTYTLTTKVTPFFSKQEGLVYNAQSLSMILSPICMALGIYLSIMAHNEIQRQTQAFFEDDLADFARPPPRSLAAAGRDPAAGGNGAGIIPRNRGAAEGGEQITNRPNSQGQGRDVAARATFERFSGTPHKLMDG